MKTVCVWISHIKYKIVYSNPFTTTLYTRHITCIYIYCSNTRYDDAFIVCRCSWYRRPRRQVDDSKYYIYLCIQSKDTVRLCGWKLRFRTGFEHKSYKVCWAERIFVIWLIFSTVSHQWHSTMVSYRDVLIEL